MTCRIKGAPCLLVWSVATSVKSDGTMHREAGSHWCTAMGPEHFRIERGNNAVSCSSSLEREPLLTDVLC